tara:strand:+ start:7209 stop:7757 length:549 start_codon:yes stop_codon:yes gene_type:complete
MRIHETTLSGVKVLELKIYEDDRGYFKETYRTTWSNDLGLVHDFVQDNISRSYHGTIRGLHYQREQPQAKLIQCISGRILDVAVDLRKKSSTFGQYYSVVLSEKNHKQLYIPEGFAHGFSVLSDQAIVHYRCSRYYDKTSERGIRWDDPLIHIDWEISKPILSEKDRCLPLLSSLKEEDIFL